MSYLLDSTWLVEYLRGDSKFVQAIRARLPDRLAMSVSTLAELYSGVSRSRDSAKAEREVHRVVSQVAVLGIDDTVARIWGREDARLTLAGQKRKAVRRSFKVAANTKAASAREAWLAQILTFWPHFPQELGLNSGGESRCSVAAQRGAQDRWCWSLRYPSSQFYQACLRSLAAR